MSHRNARRKLSLSPIAGAALAAALVVCNPASAASHAMEKGDGKAAQSKTMDHSQMSGMKHAGDMKQMAGMSATGDSDYDFAVNMRMHHQMGVDMATAELKSGKNKEMQRMANKIIAAQTKEIAVLDKWIAQHKK